MHLLATRVLVAWLVGSPLLKAAPPYPGIAPGTSHLQFGKYEARMTSRVLDARWKLDELGMGSLEITNTEAGTRLALPSGALPRIVLGDGRCITLKQGQLRIATDGRSLALHTADEASGLSLSWSATMATGDSAVVATLKIKAPRVVKLREIVFIDTAIAGARQVGEVDGSVVVAGNTFLAVEHPLARNTADGGQVRCAMPCGPLAAGQSLTCSFVVGVTPPGQLRRAFLYYLEHRRARPYQPFLHYNNWYNIILSREKERTNEAECLAAMATFRHQLVERRGTRIDGYVWDDGWDNPNTLWGFHAGFPNGFKKMADTASTHGASQGVWLSPWGGFAIMKERRLAFGRQQGYELNEQGFSLAGPRYRAAFLDSCLKMVRDHGVGFFKFDGVGNGNLCSGAEGDSADDIRSLLGLIEELRGEKPDLFISTTTGTWPSPFWLLHSDSIWRQGGDNGTAGGGNTREQWISYRDQTCHANVVKRAPLYPLNSLMLGGIIVGDRRSPALLSMDEKSLRDEIWSFFGSGTCLQELYINPEMLSQQAWDTLAAAAKWSRANRHVLVDSHWVGGDPAKGEIYGWASWHPEKSIVVLRNPSSKTRDYPLHLQSALELPDGHQQSMHVQLIHPQPRTLPEGMGNPGKSDLLTLQPFEVLVLELTPLAGE